MRELLTNDEVSTALAAIQSGDMAAAEKLYLDYEPILRRIAYGLNCADMDEATAIAAAAFMDAVHIAPKPTDRNPGALLYHRVRDRARELALWQSPVQVPLGTVLRYWTIINKYDTETGTIMDDRPSQSLQEATTAAYEACKRGDERMAADVFLAVHRAIYSHTDRVSIGTVGSPTSTCTRPGHQPRRDSASRDHNTIDIGSPDPLDVLDTYTLVHEHLLPLLNDEQHEGTIVRLRYGFPQVSDAVAAKLEAAGYQPGTVLSKHEIAEVLQVHGLGHRTILRRLQAALDTMRAYLDEDERREAAA